MSVENGKVCCNCRHNIRDKDDDDRILCWCNIEGRYLSYAEVMMTGWCRHWAKDKEVENADSDQYARQYESYV